MIVRGSCASERTGSPHDHETVIASRSGAYAELLPKLIEFVPAIRLSDTVFVTTVEKLVPVMETVTGAPPLTLTENERVPFTSADTVTKWDPAVDAVTPLTVTVFAAPLPMNFTSEPPEQAPHVAVRAAPPREPDSASYVFGPVDPVAALAYAPPTHRSSTFSCL